MNNLNQSFLSYHDIAISESRITALQVKLAEVTGMSNVQYEQIDTMEQNLKFLRNQIDFLQSQSMEYVKIIEKLSHRVGK